MIRILTIGICLSIASAFCLPAEAQGFKTEKLKKASEALGIVEQAMQLPPDATLTIETPGGELVSVRKDTLGYVEHIGVPLFQADMRVLMPSPVYDFLEFAVLTWKYKLTPNTLYLSKVMFRKGSWNSLATEHLADCVCSISNQDDRLYIVNWQREGHDVATVGIPIDYELLNNDNRRVMEREFVNQLRRFIPRPRNNGKALVAEKDLTIHGTEGLFRVPGNYFIIPELNQDVYYSFKTIKEQVDTVINGKPCTLTLEDAVPAVVVDSIHLAETMANLLLSNDGDIPETQMSIDFHLSDYHLEQLAISWHQLKDWLAQEGCSIYFACSDSSNDTIHGMLLARNSAQGYNHLFRLTANPRQFTTSKPTMQVAAYLYIPPIDSAKLFGKMPTRKSGAKIY